ncbi:MAG: hypothetical protein NTW87_03170 [Planctomycetota bacterium]|nr:hypothetical protein [Planctomycetota bacterium]
MRRWQAKAKLAATKLRKLTIKIRRLERRVLQAANATVTSSMPTSVAGNPAPLGVEPPCHA